jgi:hypothetical protein
MEGMGTMTRTSAEEGRIRVAFAHNLDAKLRAFWEGICKYRNYGISKGKFPSFFPHYGEAIGNVEFKNTV